MPIESEKTAARRASARRDFCCNVILIGCILRCLSEQTELQKQEQPAEHGEDREDRRVDDELGGKLRISAVAGAEGISCRGARAGKDDQQRRQRDAAEAEQHRES